MGHVSGIPHRYKEGALKTSTKENEIVIQINRQKSAIMAYIYIYILYEHFGTFQIPLHLQIPSPAPSLDCDML